MKPWKVQAIRHSSTSPIRSLGLLTIICKAA
jgi:hypothetical protein